MKFMKVIGTCNVSPMVMSSMFFHCSRQPAIKKNPIFWSNENFAI